MFPSEIVLRLTYVTHLREEEKKSRGGDDDQGMWLQLGRGGFSSIHTLAWMMIVDCQLRISQNII